MLQFPRQTVRLHYVADIVDDLLATCLRQISGNRVASVSDVLQTMSSTNISANKNFLALKKILMKIFQIKKKLLKDVAIAQNEPRCKIQVEFKETKINIKLV